jgi:hypothetical protein
LRQRVSRLPSAEDDLVINAALFDPSGFSRPHIFTLSGRDGSELSVAPLPTIDMNKIRQWPWSGLEVQLGIDVARFIDRCSAGD